MLLIIVVAILVLVVVIIRQRKEQFTSNNEVPFKLLFQDIIMIDTSKPYTEYFVRDQLEKYYDSQITIPDKKQLVVQICQDAQCSMPGTFEILETKGAFTFPRSQIEMSPYIQLKTLEAFDPYYLPLPITVYIETRIQVNKVYTVKDLFTNALRNNDIRVRFGTTDEHRSGYDLYFCQGDKCRLDTWQLVNYEYNFSRTYATIRITKKNK